MDPIRIGVVLGAGGTPGGVFIRATFAALEQHAGWQTASAATIVGTSAGAINGARLAADAPATQPTQLATLTRLAEHLAPPELSLADRLLAPARIAGGRALARFGPVGHDDADYDVASAPFHPGLSVVSVARRNGRRRVTRLIDATDPAAELYASAAVPGGMRPIILDGEPHVDGAVYSTTNADLIRPDDHDLLVVVAPMVPLDGGSLVARSHRSRLLTELAVWVDAAKPVLVIAPSSDDMALRATDPEAFGAAATNRVARAAALSG